MNIGELNEIIRKVNGKDRDKLFGLLKSISNFKKADIEVAMELIDIAINNPVQEDYNLFVYESSENLLGYHCTGRRPLTDAVFDLYWIVVSPKYSGKGIGTKLLTHSEEFVRQSNGRWLLAETSSRENYSGTRDFYLRKGFQVVAEIDDFYSMGESLIVYGKKFY